MELSERIKVGDLISVGTEFAIVLFIRPGLNDIWLGCMWSNGDMEGIHLSDVEVINECR